MIPLAHICQRNCDVRPDRWTKFTRDEQLTLMSLWALAPSPLMLGMNLPDNDDWTTALLTNPEVLAVNQDAEGRAAWRMAGPPVPAETWMKQLADGSFAVGCFQPHRPGGEGGFPVAQSRFPVAASSPRFVGEKRPWATGQFYSGIAAACLHTAAGQMSLVFRLRPNL